MLEKTRGFGVPDTVDPHHFIVEIPSVHSEDILIYEHFGVAASTDKPECIIRCRLARSVWQGISEELKRALNNRLREKNIKGSRWTVGDNPVERLLGKELCILAWAVEVADHETYPLAIMMWTGFKPEERWWLFHVTSQATATENDTDIGWRKALRIAFTETPRKSSIMNTGVDKRLTD